MRGTRAKVTLAWQRLRLGPRLWERGQKVAPSPGEAGPRRGGGLSASQRRRRVALPAARRAWGPGARGAKAGGRGVLRALRRWELAPCPLARSALLSAQNV